MTDYIPLITIVTPTLNNEKLLPAFFSSLNKQTYPKNRIEILIVDGGSKDATVKIAKENQVRVIPNPYILAEPGVHLGIKEAKGELIMILATDNFYYDPEALWKITQVFKDESIYAAFPKHDSDVTYSIFSKYHNNFTDPFNHFVYGYAANARTFHKIYNTVKRTEIYEVYNYLSSRVSPMIALAQGFTIRAGYQRREADIFDDCKPVMDLIHAHKVIAYVFSVSIFHETIHDISNFMRKQRWATKNALNKKNYGFSYRIKGLSCGQRLLAKLWPIYACSFILPLIHGIYKAIKDKEPLWLFHPINCWLSACASIIQVVVNYYNEKTVVSRQ